MIKLKFRRVSDHVFDTKSVAYIPFECTDSMSSSLVTQEKLYNFNPTTVKAVRMMKS